MPVKFFGTRFGAGLAFGFGLAFGLRASGVVASGVERKLDGSAEALAPQAPSPFWDEPHRTFRVHRIELHRETSALVVSVPFIPVMPRGYVAGFPDRQIQQ